MAEHPNPYGTPTGDYELGGCRGMFYALAITLALVLAGVVLRSC